MRARLVITHHVFAVCVGVGLSFLGHHGVRQWRAYRASSAAASEASQLLRQYGESLEAFAEAARVFSQLPLRPGPEAKAALGPLATAVVNMNNAYVKVEQRRASLLVQMLASQSSKDEPLACRLHASERFQWDDMRAKLNKLVVNLIVLDYDPNRAETIAAIREEQARGWPELCMTLVEGARRFRNAEVAMDCGPR